MPVKINGTTSGSVTLAAPATGSDVTLTLPTLGFGKVLQVVQATSQTSTATSSTSFADSGLSANITPSASNSKVLIMVTQAISAYSASNDRMLSAHQLVRDSTAIYGNSTSQLTHGVLVDSATAGLFEVDYTYAAVYLDSPATTSATTYKSQMRCVTATAVTAQANSVTSSIILMEIAA